MTDLEKIEEILREMDKYWADKKLSEKCGLSIQEICAHDEWFINKGILICLNCGMKNEN